MLYFAVRNCKGKGIYGKRLHKRTKEGDPGAVSGLNRLDILK